MAARLLQSQSLSSRPIADSPPSSALRSTTANTGSACSRALAEDFAWTQSGHRAQAPLRNCPSRISTAHPSRSFTLRNLGSKLAGVARCQPAIRGPPPSAGHRRRPHRVGFCRSIRQRGARPAHSRSDRDSRRRFASLASTAPASRCPRLSCRRTRSWPA